MGLLEYQQFQVRKFLNQGMTFRAAQVAARAEESELRARMGLVEGQAILCGPNRSLMIAERGEG